MTHSELWWPKTFKTSEPDWFLCDCCWDPHLQTSQSDTDMKHAVQPDRCVQSHQLCTVYINGVRRHFNVVKMLTNNSLQGPLNTYCGAFDHITWSSSAGGVCPVVMKVSTGQNLCWWRSWKCLKAPEQVLNGPYGEMVENELLEDMFLLANLHSSVQEWKRRLLYNYLIMSCLKVQCGGFSGDVADCNQLNTLCLISPSPNVKEKLTKKTPKGPLEPVFSLSLQGYCRTMVDSVEEGCAPSVDTKRSSLGNRNTGLIFRWVFCFCHILPIDPPGSYTLDL